MLKLLILCIVCCLLLTVSWAQTGSIKSNASVDLIVKNSPQQLFLLRRINQSLKYETVDSAMLGEHGEVDSIHADINVAGEETHLTLSFRKKKIRLFIPILVPGDHLKMTVDFTNPDGINFTGSARTLELYNFFTEREALDAVYYKYINALKAASKDSALIQPKIDSMKIVKGAFLRKAIANTNCAYLIVVALMNSQNGIVNFTEEEFDRLKVKYRNDQVALFQINLNEKLQNHSPNKDAKPANGTYLSGFTLPDIDGRQVSLERFKGKYVLVDFWASWCVPCRHEAPYLRQALQVFGKNNFVILSVSIDENADNWKKAINADETQDFIHLIDIHGWKSSVIAQYNIKSIPSNFLLDPDGKIIGKDLRGEKLEARLKEVIKSANLKN